MRGETRVWSDDTVELERLGARGSVIQVGFLEKVASENEKVLDTKGSNRKEAAGTGDSSHAASEAGQT